jgi:hypothetical protein
MVSVTDPYGRILGFLDRTRYLSIKQLLSCTHEATGAGSLLKSSMGNRPIQMRISADLFSFVSVSLCNIGLTRAVSTRNVLLWRFSLSCAETGMNVRVMFSFPLEFHVPTRWSPLYDNSMMSNTMLVRKPSLSNWTIPVSPRSILCPYWYKHHLLLSGVNLQYFDDAKPCNGINILAAIMRRVWKNLLRKIKTMSDSSSGKSKWCHFKIAFHKSKEQHLIKFFSKWHRINYIFEEITIKTKTTMLKFD